VRLAALAVLAIAAVAVAILVAGPGSETKLADPDAPSQLRGIPQDGIALGDPAAPVTMVEFADLQCPFCREYAQNVLPELIDRYVRTGKVRLELHLLRFIGEDSDVLARTAAGAAAKDRMWHVVELAYARQGRENSGYADERFIDELARDAGLEKVDDGPAAEETVAAGEEAARAAGIDSTPSFLIGPTGGTLERFQPQSLSAEEFTDRIDAELRR
jgi:protein-disulfide isomerase